MMKKKRDRETKKKKSKTTYRQITMLIVEHTRLYTFFISQMCIHTHTHSLTHSLTLSLSLSFSLSVFYYYLSLLVFVINTCIRNRFLRI